MDVSQGASFGMKLRRLRRAAGLTQEELAERAGLTAKGIGALERGDRRRPYPHTVRALAAALGLSADAFAELVATVPPRGQLETDTIAPAAYSLPALPGPLVGREQDVAVVTGILAGEGRLLTLTGPGGVGKTSLAIEAGHRLQRRFPGGIAFVPLARLDDPGLLLESIVHALGLRDAAGRSLRDVLVAALQEREVLLILDNVEHLLPAATDVSQLLAMCPSIRILVTSRSPLRVRGEREYAVSPLAIPAAGQPPAMVCLTEVPSVQLFVQRASAVSPAFSLTDENAGAIASICRRLDGLPLAIELAAARIRILSPAALLQRLDPLLPVLVGGARDLPERQQTVRASITWSHNLLAEAERTLFRRLSVFAGGWTIEGAEALAPSLDIFVVLERLVEASLVVREPGDDRYRMLQPIREYASGTLEESGETREIRDRHAAFFLALARDADAGLKGREQLRWLQRLDEEHDNMRIALAWLLGGSGDAQGDALRLAAMLARYWFLRGHWSEGRSWLERVLGANEGHCSVTRAMALEAAGLIAQFQNDYDHARTYLEESLALYRQRGDESGEASALGKLGFVSAFQNDLDRVSDLSTAVEPFVSRLKDQGIVAHLLVFLGLASVIQGALGRGLDLHDRALSVFRQLGDVHGMVWCLTNMGLLKLVSGDLRAATTLLQEDLGLAVRLGEPASIQYALLGLATVASQEGQPARAARLWGAAEAIRQAAGMELNALARAQTMYDRWVDHARNEAGFDHFTTNWTIGATMSMEQVVSYAMLREDELSIDKV